MPYISPILLFLISQFYLCIQAMLVPQCLSTRIPFFFRCLLQAFLRFLLLFNFLLIRFRHCVNHNFLICIIKFLCQYFKHICWYHIVWEYFFLRSKSYDYIPGIAINIKILFYLLQLNGVATSIDAQINPKIIETILPISIGIFVEINRQCHPFIIISYSNYNIV